MNIFNVADYKNLRNGNVSIVCRLSSFFPLSSGKNAYTCILYVKITLNSLSTRDENS